MLDRPAIGRRAILLLMRFALRRLLFRAFDRGRVVHATIGGVVLGLSMYTYFAARLLPLIAIPILAFELASLLT